MASTLEFRKLQAALQGVPGAKYVNINIRSPFSRNDPDLKTCKSLCYRTAAGTELQQRERFSVFLHFRFSSQSRLWLKKRFITNNSWSLHSSVGLKPITWAWGPMWICLGSEVTYYTLPGNSQALKNIMSFQLLFSRSEPTLFVVHKSLLLNTQLDFVSDNDFISVVFFVGSTVQLQVCV